MLDARDPDRRRADLSRILDVKPQPRTREMVGWFALVLFLFCVVAIATLRGAQVADDVEATRDRVERMDPCRR